jgi:UDP-arabinose 4-epimerase
MQTTHEEDGCLMCCRYYHNITSNTLGLVETMVRHRVHKLIYSSTCATYGEPESMPIKETTPQVKLTL